MNETAPLPPRTPNATQAQPAPPAQRPDPRGEQQPPSQQQGKGGDPSAAKPAPAFKEPAISLSPRVAGIQVGDVLEGRVERIDAQQRAVVQNAKETLLVDPAAGLKSGGPAKIKVTQTVPQFLGQLISTSAKPEPDIPVRLALVAVRGVDLTQQAAKGAAAPQAPPQNPIGAGTQGPNSIADILRTSAQVLPKTMPSAAPQIPYAAKLEQPVPSAPKTQQAATPNPALQAQAAAKPTPPVQAAAAQQTQARPTLLQSLVSRIEGGAAADSKAVQTFVTRHPGISGVPKPLVMTLLPASAAQVTYAKIPAATSPLGKLLENGRALLATVQTTPAGQISAAARVPLAAGSLRIDVPSLPDMPLKAGEKVVLLSANAEPMTSERAKASGPKTSTAPIANSQAGTSAPAVSGSLTLQWPALHNALATVLSQSPGALPAMLSTRTSQLFTSVFGLTVNGAAQAAERLKLALPMPVKTALKDSPTLQTALAQVSKGMPEVDRLLQTQLDPLQQALTAGGAARPDAAAMPIIIPNSEASLIASLFHYPLSQEEAPPREDQNGQRGKNSEDKAFDVSLTFEKFGRTRISGNVTGKDLGLTIETETAMPEALEGDLTSLFHDRCEACNYTGAIRFQRAD